MIILFVKISKGCKFVLCQQKDMSLMFEWSQLLSWHTWGYWTAKLCKEENMCFIFIQDVDHSASPEGIIPWTTNQQNCTGIMPLAHTKTSPWGLLFFGHLNKIIVTMTVTVKHQHAIWTLNVHAWICCEYFPTNSLKLCWAYVQNIQICLSICINACIVADWNITRIFNSNLDQNTWSVNKWKQEVKLCVFMHVNNHV